MLMRIAFSGQFGSGKDWIAEHCGMRILSVAQPMYAVCEYFFGHCDKSRHDIRDFLQTIGQWGWGYDNEEEAPCTIQRARFINMMRQQGALITGFKGPWQDFGKRKDFWISMLLDRLEEDGPHSDRVAITNIRFPHEEHPVHAHGFTHFVVTCSEETRIERQKAKAGNSFNYTKYLELSKNVSERYAGELLSRFDHNRVIWNDHRPNPAGYLTVGKFKELINERDAN